MTLKRTKVVMLPTTDKTSRLIKSDAYSGVRNLLAYQSKKHFKNDRKHHLRERFHLYFLSDDEIKEGEKGIFYDFDYNRITRIARDVNGNRHFKYRSIKKIIATTDSSLKPICKCSESESTYCGSKCQKPLPQPSQDFLKVFVEQYNKGNVIEWVDVEYGKRKVNYLSTRYDRMDEYYQLNSTVSKEDFLLFMQPIINKCTSFKDFNPTKHSIDKAANKREESLYHIVGGFFGKVGYYPQDFYNNWLPKNLKYCLIKDKNLTERRFNWLIEELSNLKTTYLKVNFKNEIAIKKIKDSWNREEVEALLIRHQSDYRSHVRASNPFSWSMDIKKMDIQKSLINLGPVAQLVRATDS